MKRKWAALAAAAVAVVALGAGALAVQAQENDGGTSLLDRVAQKLGIESPALEQAIKDARSDEIDAAVQSGDLTQEQADALKQRLDELPAGAPFLRGFGAGGDHLFEFETKGHGFGLPLGLLGPPAGGVNREALAAFLGIDVAQLQTELQADGATLATVAEAHEKSRDELKAFLRERTQERLDALVADGDLTQERADDILARFDQSADELIDLPGAAGLGFEGRFKKFPGLRHGDGADEEDDTPDQSGEATPSRGT